MSNDKSVQSKHAIIRNLPGREFITYKRNARSLIEVKEYRTNQLKRLKGVSYGYRATHEYILTGWAKKAAKTLATHRGVSFRSLSQQERWDLEFEATKLFTSGKRVAQTKWYENYPIHSTEHAPIEPINMLTIRKPHIISYDAKTKTSSIRPSCELFMCLNANSFYYYIYNKGTLNKFAAQTGYTLVAVNESLVNNTVLKKIYDDAKAGRERADIQGNDGPLIDHLRKLILESTDAAAAVKAIEFLTLQDKAYKETDLIERRKQKDAELELKRKQLEASKEIATSNQGKVQTFLQHLSDAEIVDTPQDLEFLLTDSQEESEVDE